MRDPARIDRMVEKLRRLWHSTPDQRLGQLIVNVTATVNPWVPEDDDTERCLDAWLAKTGGS